jgi:hypothetical protein
LIARARDGVGCMVGVRQIGERRIWGAVVDEMVVVVVYEGKVRSSEMVGKVGR